MSEQRAVPTVEELKRAYDEGLEQELISGVKVKMHSVRIEDLLRKGNLPDILTPIVIKTLFEDTHKERDAYLFAPRQESEDTLKMIAGVDAVCEAALIDPSVVPYLSLSDRMWIFKLAFMPAAVLSTFRFRQEGDVETEGDSEGFAQPTERVDESA